MNKQGQVLIPFLILLPILLLLVGLIIDFGMAYQEKRKMEHVIKDTITYALNHITEEESTLKINMTYLLNENLKNLHDIRIEIKEKKVTIRLEKKIETIFLPKKNTVKLSYQGVLENGEKRIQKEG